jgi:hypothetical protein
LLGSAASIVAFEWGSGRASRINSRVGLEESSKDSSGSDGLGGTRGGEEIALGRSAHTDTSSTLEWLGSRADV